MPYPNGFADLGPAEPKTFSISGTNATFTIPGQPGKRIHVLGFTLAPTVLGRYNFKSGTTLLGTTLVGDGQTAIFPCTPDGWFTCDTGEDFVIENVNARDTRGFVRYVYV